MVATDSAEQDRADMERLVRGHDSALNALMDRHSGPLFQFLFRMLNDEQEASDLAQETFVRVYRHRERYDGRKFTTWLYSIAANLARTEFRRRSRHPNISLEVEASDTAGTLAETLASRQASPSEEANKTEQHRMVREAVAALPTDLKDVLILCEWEEMPVAEAAAVLNTTLKGAESRLFRARKLLKEKLRKWL